MKDKKAILLVTEATVRDLIKGSLFMLQGNIHIMFVRDIYYPNVDEVVLCITDTYEHKDRIYMTDCDEPVTIINFVRTVDDFGPFTIKNTNITELEAGDIIRFKECGPWYKVLYFEDVVHNIEGSSRTLYMMYLIKLENPVEGYELKEIDIDYIMEKRVPLR